MKTEIKQFGFKPSYLVGPMSHAAKVLHAVVTTEPNPCAYISCSKAYDLAIKTHSETNEEDERTQYLTVFLKESEWDWIPGVRFSVINNPLLHCVSMALLKEEAALDEFDLLYTSVEEEYLSEPFVIEFDPKSLSDKPNGIYRTVSATGRRRVVCKTSDSHLTVTGAKDPGEKTVMKIIECSGTATIVARNSQAMDLLVEAPNLTLLG